MYITLNTLVMTRKRKSVTYRIDEAVKDVIERLARKHNTSVNRFVESTLFDLCQKEGYLQDLEPLGETRGGDRKSDNYKEEIDD